MPDCDFGDISCTISNAASSAFDSIVKKAGQAAIWMIKFLSSFWFKVPSPEIASVSGNSASLSPTVSFFSSTLAPYIGFFAVTSFLFGVGRLAWSQWHRGDGSETQNLVRQVVVTAAGTLAVAAVTQLLVMAGDEFSPWIIGQAAGTGNPSDGMKQLLTVGFASGSPTGLMFLWLLLFLVAILASIVQCIFMIFRGAVLILLMVFVPFFAATTASPDGWQRFKRICALLLGFVLFKPVAAVIYAVGIKLMSTQSSHDHGPDVASALYGMTIMLIAALALPALIKFLVPAAAMGSSSAFSGGAAVGAVAAGAALVATRGMSARAGGAAGGGSFPAGMSAGAKPSSGGGSFPAGMSGGGGGSSSGASGNAVKPIADGDTSAATGSPSPSSSGSQQGQQGARPGGAPNGTRPGGASGGSGQSGSAGLSGGSQGQPSGGTQSARGASAYPANDRSGGSQARGGTSGTVARGVGDAAKNFARGTELDDTEGAGA